MIDDVPKPLNKLNYRNPVVAIRQNFTVTWLSIEAWSGHKTEIPGAWLGHYPRSPTPVHEPIRLWRRTSSALEANQFANKLPQTCPKKPNPGSRTSSALEANQFGSGGEPVRHKRQTSSRTSSIPIVT